MQFLNLLAQKVNKSDSLYFKGKKRLLFVQPDCFCAQTEEIRFQQSPPAEGDVQASTAKPFLTHGQCYCPTLLKLPDPLVQWLAGALQSRYEPSIVNLPAGLAGLELELSDLPQCVPPDRDVLRLIKMWPNARIEKQDKYGTPHRSGCKRNRCGTPQVGVASPLLANLYMNRFLKYWRLSGCGEAFRAHVVSYSDNSVILSRGRAPGSLALTKLGLTIKERFDFLGHSFGLHDFGAKGKWYLGASPSKKSMALKDQGRRLGNRRLTSRQAITPLIVTDLLTASTVGDSKSRFYQPKQNPGL